MEARTLGAWLAALLITTTACSNPEDPPLAQDASGTSTDAGGDSTAPPPTDTVEPADGAGDQDPGPPAEVVDDAAGEETAETPDANHGDSIDAGPTLPPATALRRWGPALAEGIVLTVDAVGLRAELLGAQPIQIATWADGDLPSSPVAVGGLLCWDIDKDGVFDVSKEDFDDDGLPSKADCALHPGGASPGSPGAVVAVTQAGGGCTLHAWTAFGTPVWVEAIGDTCRQPTSSGQAIVVPVTEADGGKVRMYGATDGKLRGQVALPGTPLTPAAQVGPDRFAVGMLGSVSILVVLGGDTPAVFVDDTLDVSPDRPTAAMSAGPGRMAVAVRTAQDPQGSYGTRVRRFDLTASLAELPGVIQAPGPLWAPPVTGAFAGEWAVVAGGAGWVSAWRVADGSLLWTQSAQLGTVTGVTVGGDERAYVAEIDWSGSAAEQAGADWQVWSYAPDLDSVWAPIIEGTDDTPLRWLGPPALLCDLLIGQVIPDAAEISTRIVAKPCAEALYGEGSPRGPAGDNGNRGMIPPTANCAPGPGIAPCDATGGCEVNPDCDDQNPCTLDSCVSGVCSYKFLPGCCVIDADCDDLNACTLNACKDGKCEYKPSSECCESSSECDDYLPCTENHCEQGFCVFVPNPQKPGCCEEDGDCSDGDPCVFTGCDGQTATCVYVEIPECCLFDGDCDDANLCTEDACTEMQCDHEPTPDLPGCCATEEACDDANPCTEDTCESSLCVHKELDECCTVDLQCEDELQCTADTCVDQKCQYELDPSLEGCCETDADCVFEPDPCIFGIICNPETAMCEEEAMECDDEDPCTEDECVEGECVFTPDAELCCETDTDCDDGNVCTEDSCDAGQQCVGIMVPGCCNFDEECEDGLSATDDQCLQNACVTCETFDFLTETVPVDIVFVVDQSVSMTDLIPAVRDYLNDFAAFIAAEGIDYHVILIATRFKGENQICIEPPLASEGCKDSDLFMQIEKQVGSHDALQLIMDNIDAVESFMREGSNRQFVVLTDDESVVPAANFDFFLASRPGYDGWVFHGVFGTTDPSCATGIGVWYLALADGTGGLSIDICGLDWTESFEQLGASTGTATTSYPITHEPVSGTLTVVIGGVGGEPGVDWEYDPVSGRIVLLPPYPPAGTAIKACYQPVAEEL